MLFEEALPLLRNGAKIARTGWNGKDQFLYIVKGEKLSEAIKLISGNDVPVTDQVWINSTSKKNGPFSLSHCDLMAEDWVLLEHL